MSGLEVAHLLGVDSLPKNTLLEPPIQKGKNKEKQRSFTLVLNEKLEKNHVSSLKCFLILKILK